MNQSLKNRVKKITREILSKRKEEHIPKEPSWWTCFYYDGFTPDQLHCTHKYLGVLDDTSIKEIKKILDQYFDNKPFEKFKVSFNKETFFGKDNDIRVLTPIEFNPEHFLLDLRSRLDKFKKDDYDSYNPHVTTDKSRVDLPFKGYALLLDDKMIKTFES